jgi:uncharacterized protein
MNNYLNIQTINHQLSNLRQLTFEITDACNLKCKYCAYGEFYNDYDKRGNTNLSIEKAFSIIDYLVGFWDSEQNNSADRNVYISFYGGEPLLNMPFVEEVINYLHQLPIKNRHFTFSMTTNGVLLHKYMDFIAKEKFSLLISLDGDFENNAYRVNQSGDNSYNNIIRNVELMKQKHPDYFEKYVNFNAVLHNKNSVEDIYKFFKQKFNKIPSIGELNNMGIRPDKTKLFMETYRNQMESLEQSEHYEKIEKDMFIQSPNYQQVCTFLHQYSGYVFRDYNELLYGKQEQNDWITGTCAPFGKKMFVTVNGKILPCERIGHQFALGYIDKQGVRLDFEKIALRYNQYLNKLDTQCKACYNKKSCTQCIFNIENIDENPICHGFMNKEDFDNYVQWNMNFLAKHPEDYYKLMEEIVVE